MVKNSLDEAGVLGSAGTAWEMERVPGLPDHLSTEARAITEGMLGLEAYVRDMNRGLGQIASSARDALAGRNAMSGLGCLGRDVSQAVEARAITDGLLGVGAYAQNAHAGLGQIASSACEALAGRDAMSGLGCLGRDVSQAVGLADRLSAEARSITEGMLGLGAHAQHMSRTLGLVERFKTEARAMTEPLGLTVRQATLARESAMSIQCIGRALDVARPFDGSVTTILRVHLGDWRGLCSWPDAIIDNQFTRTDFYRALGFTDHLASMPETAFYRCLDRFGVHLPALPNVGGADRAQSSEARSERDESVARNCEAYELLLRFEVALRCFIDSVMRNAFGRDWVKHRVPGDVYKHWREKSQDATDAGESVQPLINYADFSDYVKIIARSDNWRDLFQSIFKRREDVQEAFCRLHPIHLCTMHARSVTADDHLLLRVETRRILKAIRIISD